MKLRHQILVTATLVFIALLAMVVAGLLTFRIASMADNKARINQLFLSSYSVLIEFEKMAADGALSDDQAKALATRVLRNNIYKDNEYVYVADEKMMFVATPLDPQLHGTSFDEFKDAQGQSVGDILRRAVEKQPNGIAEYDWNSERDGKVVDLTSIARKTPRWGWYVGTGISYADVDARFWSTALWQLASGLVLALIAIGLLLRSLQRLERMFGDEPTAVRSFALKVAQGELHQSSQQFDNQSIRGAMQQMEQNLYQMVASCEQAAHQLAEVAKQANGNSACVTDLVSSQQAETELVAAATHQLTTSAHSVLNSAKEAAKATDEADTEGQQATRVMQQVVSSIQGLAGNLDKTNHVVQDLGSSVAKIATVLDVIKNIAEQTNLLALNAAIEAARAGEQGRGFAVVADEVRNLAQRSQQSTLTIQQIIEKLQHDATAAMSEMQHSRTLSEHAVNQTLSTAQLLQKIAAELGTISDRNRAIALAASEQCKVGEDISSRIEKIAMFASDTRQQAQTSRDVNQQLTRLSQQLEGLLQHFHLKD